MIFQTLKKIDDWLNHQKTKQIKSNKKKILLGSVFYIIGFATYVMIAIQPSTTNLLGLLGGLALTLMMPSCFMLLKNIRDYSYLKSYILSELNLETVAFENFQSIKELINFLLSDSLFSHESEDDALALSEIKEIEKKLIINMTILEEYKDKKLPKELKKYVQQNNDEMFPQIENVLINYYIIMNDPKYAKFKNTFSEIFSTKSLEQKYQLLQIKEKESLKKDKTFAVSEFDSLDEKINQNLKMLSMDKNEVVAKKYLSL